MEILNKLYSKSDTLDNISNDIELAMGLIVDSNKENGYLHVKVHYCQADKEISNV